ncbi:hypothetical protein BB559_005550 [Furculomyces boomerangus]|uniref:Splicing factor YJU2 n=1 Tax=Furculomyces boomerangus TaxID=61424 RepID=A0A2T9Y824_9FUNG|nr:hypothetical protein BB559_005550 [Furculomyces boomerangus]
MAERKAVNKYYPPEWDPSKGSINTFVGQHPLRDRARKLGLGILIVRFEMPFNIWCGGCKSMIATGIRFNAEKKQIGNYYSTPIWSFRMKCRFCSHWFEIHTDPKNAKYDVIRGATKKDEDFSENSDDGAIFKDSEATKKRKIDDALFNLEHKINEKKKADMQARRIQELLDVNYTRFENHGQANALLRNKFRTEKRIIQEKDSANKKLQEKYSLGFKIDEESTSDKIYAGAIDFKSSEIKKNDAIQLAKFSSLKKRLSSTKNQPGNSTTKDIDFSKNKLFNQALSSSDPFLNPKKHTNLLEKIPLQSFALKNSSKNTTKSHIIVKIEKKPTSSFKNKPGTDLVNTDYGSSSSSPERS